jgi:hypothetical protein
MAQVKLYKFGSAFSTEHAAADDITFATVTGTSLIGGNVTISGNSVISTDTNGDLNLTPNGTGDLVLDGVNWPQADGSSGQFLKTDGAGQTSWADPSASSVIDTANYVADTAGVSARDMVYVSAAGKVLACDANAESSARAIGFATNTALATAAVNVQSAGVLAGFSGLTAGARYWMSETAGAITSTPPTTSSANLIQAGFGASTTKLQIQIVPVVIRA